MNDNTFFPVKSMHIFTYIFSHDPKGPEELSFRLKWKCSPICGYSDPCGQKCSQLLRNNGKFLISPKHHIFPLYLQALNVSCSVFRIKFNCSYFWGPFDVLAASTLYKATSLTLAWVNGYSSPKTKFGGNVCILELPQSYEPLGRGGFRTHRVCTKPY